MRKGLADEIRNAFQDWSHGAIKVGHDRLAIHDVRLVFPVLDKTVQRAAGSRSVHREFQSKPCAFANGKRNERLPFVRSPNDFSLGIYDMIVIVKVPPRIEHQHAADTEALHRLQIGRDRFAVGVAIDPPPVAPRPC